ncbi:Uncharacterised protein [Escherichia coli]|nr:Uncharacterised protein [Escherichia coli]CAD6089793.1 Uncharacterised protein [Escherichia coli]CAD6118718.1 Uncharacterised protein [Escherichia coli]
MVDILLLPLSVFLRQVRHEPDMMQPYSVIA